MPMRSSRLATLILIVVACIVAAPLLAGAQTPKRGGTLRVSYGNEIAHLDFHTAPGYEMMWVAMNVGCGLVNITPDGKFVGDAAELWHTSPDGLLYTFKLRKNVLFHDGTPVDAAAVKFSIDRLMDPATKSGMRSFYDSVHSVEVLDPASVQIRLKQPYAFMLHMLAAYRTGLVLYSPTATQKYTLEDRKQGKPEAVVGCGPFKLVEWVKGGQLVMERFDKYFVPGLPYLDRVVIRVIKDPVTEMAAFKAGEIDFIASFSPDHVETLKAQNPRAQIMTGKETTPMLAAMKVTVPKDGKPMSKDRAPHPVFGDLRVRKAIGCYGIDRKEIVKIAFQGHATPWVWMNPTLNDGPWDMYVEDLLSLITLDSNAYLSNSTSTWTHPRHNDKRTDELYARYARELDAAKRKAIAREIQEFFVENMYWNNISGSPFYMVAQPWMKGYVYNAEFEVHYDRVWLDK